MASSISSSEDIDRGADRDALPFGLRLTAANRPGVAQPVPERDIPNQPWRAVALVVMILVALLTPAGEWKMRTLELVPGDLGANYDSWAELRREVDKRDVPVAIIGDSRILYDTDLDRAKLLTSIRPLQLAIAGGSGVPILEDLADDPHFKGLAIVGIAENAYFETQYLSVRPLKAIELSRWESPSKRGSFLIQRVLFHNLAMLDDDYQLSTLVFRLDWGWRPGVTGPYDEPWKMQELAAGGQTWIWRRIEHDQRIREHARNVWHHFFLPNPLGDANINAVLVRTNIAVDKIRSRGGDVVFVRPPSAPSLRTVEDKHLPKDKGWDALLAYTHTNGVHIDDLPAAQNLTLPDESHLARACATVFTDAYIRALAHQTSLLQLRSDAPPALSAQDCVQPSIGRTK